MTSLNFEKMFDDMQKEIEIMKKEIILLKSPKEYMNFVPKEYMNFVHKENISNKHKEKMCWKKYTDSDSENIENLFYGNE